VAGRPDHSDHDHDQRAEDDGAFARVLDRGVDRAREDVADHDRGADPDPAAEHAVREELAEAHAGAAGDEGGEGADEADEAADEDRFAAVAREEVLHLFEALVGEAEAGAVLEEELAAEAATEEEAGDVAGAGHRPGEGDGHVEVDRALAGDGAAEQHHRLAGRDEADEGAGLGEGEEADQGVGPGAEGVGDVLEDLLQIEDLGEEVVGDPDRDGDRGARSPLALGRGAGELHGALPAMQTMASLRSRVAAADSASESVGKSPTAVGPDPLKKTAPAVVPWSASSASPMSGRRLRAAGSRSLTSSS